MGMQQWLALLDRNTTFKHGYRLITRLPVLYEVVTVSTRVKVQIIRIVIGS